MTQVEQEQVEQEQGYRVPQTTLRLEFTDPEHSGLVVRVREPSEAAIEECGKLAFVDDSEPLSEAAYSTLVVARDHFAKALVSWNLRHPETGKPVPATRAGLKSLPSSFVGELLGAWLTGIFRVQRAALAARRVSEADLPVEMGG